MAPLAHLAVNIMVTGYYEKAITIEPSSFKQVITKYCGRVILFCLSVLRNITGCKDEIRDLLPFFAELPD
jgi:hypothetical protein